MINASFGSARDWLVVVCLAAAAFQISCKSRCRPGTTLQKGLCVAATPDFEMATAATQSTVEAPDGGADKERAAIEIAGAGAVGGAGESGSAGVPNVAHATGAAATAPAVGGANGTGMSMPGGGADAMCTPAAETCDGIDNDCDGKTDEQVAIKCWADHDGDGFAAVSAEPVESCDACGPLQTPNEPNGPLTTDCDDADETTSPGATDVCGDDIDNDCDGMPDDEANNACNGSCTMQLAGKPGEPCGNGLKGACARMGTYECQPDHTLKCSATVVMGTVEECGDNSDNDCDGVVDNTCVMNECGGWTGLNPDRGTACSMGSGSCRATGSYECSGTDQTICTVQPKTPNECGGCTALSNLGDRCTATCSPDGQYVCDGTDATRCNVTAKPMNGCGGCNVLAHERNSSCTGECNARGTYACVAGRNDQTECRVASSAARNSCGGCGQDPSGIKSGDYCAAGMNSCAVIGTYQCTGSGDAAALACSARPQSPTNGCGGCVGPNKGTSCVATDSSGNSVDGIYVCDGELTYCAPRT